MIPYEILAAWYDELMGDVPYDQWADRILHILCEQSPAPKRLLELACGTGRITGRLLEAGYWVTAVDQSEAMLQAARENLGSGSGRLRLVASDMLDFTTTEKFDGIISVCDGFNYLAELEDLSAMLEKCAGLCKPGGLILFDLSTDWKFTQHLQDTVIAESHEDMAYIWENHYDNDARRLEFDLTFFIQDGALFRRETEHHIQRAHSPEEITAICARLGLTPLGFFNGYTGSPIKKDSERFHCIIKNGGNS